MSCFQIPKALPSLSLSHCKLPSQYFIRASHNPKPKKKFAWTNIQKQFQELCLKKSRLAIQVGALLATVEQPAFAVTGVNNEEDLTTVLTDSAIAAVWYFFIMPPIIMNWLRIRWYKRKLLEMYLQFMFVFLFFPGILIWAPFLNFRKFPRDPSMKNPWSTPEDPSKIRSSYPKYPFAEPEDYA